MSRGAVRRQQLFELYARNLSLHRPEMVERFLCPICLAEFDEAVLGGDPPKIDLAHILPKAVGGRRVTLTCRDCNNRMGWRYDSHLAAHVRDQDWRKGKLAKKARIKFPNYDFGVDWSKTESGFHLEVKAGTFRPGAEDELLGLLRDKGTIQIQTTMANPRMLRYALVHTAVLMMFERFGYEYILQPNFDIVRNALLGCSNELDFRRIVCNVSNVRVDRGNPDRRISISYDPPEFSCFVVLVPMDCAEIAETIVLLPGFGARAAATYKQILHSASPTWESKCNAFGISPAPTEALVDPRRSALARGMWDRGLDVEKE